MENPLIAYLSRFTNVPSEDIDSISDAFTVLVSKPGTVLLRAGGKVSRLYFLEKGLLKLVVPRSENESSVFWFVEEDQLIGFLRIFCPPDINPYHLIAVTEVVVWSIDLLLFKELCVRLKYLEKAILKATKLSVADSILKRGAYLGLSAYQKYEMLLQVQRNVAHLAPLKDIASYLEITPQSLSRVRRQMVSTI